MKTSIDSLLNNIETKLSEESQKFGDIVLSEEAIKEMYSLKTFKTIRKSKPLVHNLVAQNSQYQTQNSQLVNQNTSQYPSQSLPQKSVNIDKSVVNPNWIKSENLVVLNDNIKNCLSCGLGLGRTNFVFGSGNPKAKIMIIGEAPGADEDAEGLPFVGRAGQLLTKIIESIQLTRDEVYIANIIKCRPPNNRRPNEEEVKECEPYLLKQIDIINPEFILALGLTAVDTLTKSKNKMQDVRGNILNYHGRKLLVTYHPAALLRNPNWKRFVWEDVKNLRRMYDEYLIQSK